METETPCLSFSSPYRVVLCWCFDFLFCFAEQRQRKFWRSQFRSKSQDWAGLHQLQLQFLFFHVFPVPGHLLDDCFPFGPSRASSDSHSFCCSIHLEELHSQRIRLWIPKKRGKTWVWMKIAPKRILKICSITNCTVNQSCLKNKQKKPSSFRKNLQRTEKHLPDNGVVFATCHEPSTALDLPGRKPWHGDGWTPIESWGMLQLCSKLVTPSCVQKWRVFLPVETYSKFPACGSSHGFRSFLGHPASLWESSACTFFPGLLPCRQRARTDLQHIGSQASRAFCFRHFWYSGSGGYFTCGTTWRLSQGRQTAEANYCYPLKPVAGIYHPNIDPENHSFWEDNSLPNPSFPICQNLC